MINFIRIIFILPLMKVAKINTAKKTVYIKTFGCSVNQSDAEVMGGLLEEAGYNVVSAYGDENKFDAEDPKHVDVVIINTCTVKNLAETKFFKELRKWKNGKNKSTNIIVTGCIPQAEPELLNEQLKNISVIGTRQVVHVVDIVKDALHGKVVHNLENDKNETLALPKVRRVGVVEIIPISEGCMSACTYCKTKLARGEILSYPKEKIITQFRSALKDGCKEFWITSQDNGCYGFDIYRKEKYFLPQLLNDLLALEGDFRIRLGMSNPNHVDRIKDDLVKTFKHPKIFKFLHIPVQSGNDKVLREMKRSYTIKDFYGIIDLFRKKIPGITISTDLIAGFPGETDKEFDDTLKLIRNVKFDVLNFSRFWMRKGTPAENMKQLPSGIIKERAEKIKQLFNDMVEEQNTCWLNKECTILIDEYGKDGVLIGRNDYYKQILLRNSDKNSGVKLGDFVKVRIVETHKYTLTGMILSDII
jgi:threonylcarbamoyladenosine tRNA methylthiotransferase CDKAL1